MRRLVEPARIGHLATIRPDGRPHVVPVCFVLLGEVLYSAVDHKPKRHQRLRRLANVEATGHACLLVDGYSEDWSKLWWVRLDGRGRVLAESEADESARALDALVGKYRQYSRQTPTGPVMAVLLQS